MSWSEYAAVVGWVAATVEVAVDAAGVVASGAERLQALDTIASATQDDIKARRFMESLLHCAAPTTFRRASRAEMMGAPARSAPRSFHAPRLSKTTQAAARALVASVAPASGRARSSHGRRS